MQFSISQYGSRLFSALSQNRVIDIPPSPGYRQNITVGYKCSNSSIGDEMTLLIHNDQPFEKWRGGYDTHAYVRLAWRQAALR